MTLLIFLSHFLFNVFLIVSLGGLPGGLVVNNPYANMGAEDVGWSWGQEDPLEEELATHSGILAWEIP